MPQLLPSGQESWWERWPISLELPDSSQFSPSTVLCVLALQQNVPQGFSRAFMLPFNSSWWHSQSHTYLSTRGNQRSLYFQSASKYWPQNNKWVIAHASALEPKLCCLKARAGAGNALTLPPPWWGCSTSKFSSQNPKYWHWTGGTRVKNQTWTSLLHCCQSQRGQQMPEEQTSPILF